MTTPSPLPAQSEEESSICLKCGLCCDGTLFDFATLQEPEVHLFPPNQRLDNPASDESALAFALPCQHFRSQTCTVYPDRPDACRVFACRVLADFRNGTKTKAHCLAIIDDALGTRNRIDALLEVGGLAPSARRSVVAQMLKDARAGGTLPATGAVEAVAFERFLDRHFRHPGQGRIARDED